ncbi:hypothetical protein FA15DRAFT_667871, partial [Coprinopsis marcescibilis]
MTTDIAGRFTPQVAILGCFILCTLPRTTYCSVYLGQRNMSTYLFGASAFKLKVQLQRLGIRMSESLTNLRAAIECRILISVGYSRVYSALLVFGHLVTPEPNSHLS